MAKAPRRSPTTPDQGSAVQAPANADARPAEAARERGPGDDRLEVSFMTSAPRLELCPPPDQPEIAFAGRSNSGKSSVLNRLTGNRQTAKVSKTPGRTQLLNFFEVHRVGRRPSTGRIIDLPGYGYAKAGRDAQAAWQKQVNRFLSERECLAAVVLVMDIRHPLQPYDEELIGWAEASELPLLVLLNKADKLKFGAQQQTLAQVRRRLRDVAGADAVTFSAMRGLNLTALLDAIEGWLAPSEPHPS